MSQMLVDDNEGQKASATSTQGELPCLLMEPKEVNLVGTEDCSSLGCVKLRTSEKATQTESTNSPIQKPVQRTWATRC